MTKGRTIGVLAAIMATSLVTGTLFGLPVEMANAERISDFTAIGTEDHELRKDHLNLNLTAVNNSFQETITAEWKSSKEFYTTGEDIFTTILADIKEGLTFKKENGETIKPTFGTDGDYIVIEQIINTAGSYTLTIELKNTHYQFDSSDKTTAELKVDVKQGSARLDIESSSTISYGSFDDAWNVVNAVTWEAFTITLYGQQSCEGFTVGAGIDFTLDLNGYQMIPHNSIGVEGMFALKDSSESLSGKIEGSINVSRGSFKWAGGDIGTVNLEAGTCIEVQESFKAPTEQIDIKVDTTDPSFKVLSWETGTADPTAYFKSAEAKACFYKGSNAAFIGKHSVVYDGTPSWSGHTSVTFDNIHCEQCNKTTSATLDRNNIQPGAKVDATCTKNGSQPYSATLTLEAVQSVFDKEYSTWSASTLPNLTAETTEMISSTGHEWVYTATTNGVLTATCSHGYHDESKDGDKEFSLTIQAPTETTYNASPIEVTVSGNSGAEPFITGHTLIYKYNKETNSGYEPHGTPQEAGYYQAVLTANGDKGSPKTEATLEFEIKKATITISGTYTDNKEYDGTLYSQSVKKAEAELKQLTVSMAPVEDPNFVISITTTGTAATTYTGKIETADVIYDTANFDLVISNVGYSVTINRKVLSANNIAWGTLTFEYDGSAHKPTATIQTGVHGEADIDLTVSVDKGIAINADGYTATAELPADETNYQLDGRNTMQFTITPQAVTVVWDNLRLPYNGEAQQPTATATDKQGKSVDPLTVTVTELTHINAGEYNATATTANTNYTLNSNTAKFNIVACEIELDPLEKAQIEGYIAKTKVYDGDTNAIVTATKEYLDRFSGVQVEFTLSASFNSKNVSAANAITVQMTLTDTTNFQFKASTVGVEYNVQGDYLTIYWQISKGVSITAKSLAVNFDGLTQTYTSTALAPTATAATGVGSERVTLSVTLEDGKGYTGKLSSDGKAINAGTYKATAKITDVSSDAEVDNYTLVTPTGEFEIEKAALTITWPFGSSYSYVYGTAKIPEPSANFRGNDGKTTVIKVVEKDAKEFKNVGSYTFQAELEGDATDNYHIASGSEQAYTITRAELTALLSAEVVYGDELGLESVQVTVSGGVQYGEDEDALAAAIKAALVEFSTEYDANTTPANAENATITAESFELKNYTVVFAKEGKVTVLKRQITITLSGARANIYGADVYGTITASAERYGGGTWYGHAEDEEKLGSELEFIFRKDGTGNEKVYDPRMAAGTYTVTAAWKSESALKANYEIVNEGPDTEYTVNKAPLTVTAHDNEITYGDAPSNGGVEYSGFVNGESVSVLGGTLTFDYDGYEAFKDVGDYKITPSGYTSSNYDIQFVAGTLKVNAKEISAEWSEKSYTYTGSAFDPPTATAKGVGDDDGTFALKVSPSFTGEFKNAGSYVFKAELDSSNAKAKNYTLKESTTTHTYTVEKQTVTVPTISSKVYNGAKQTADVAPSTFYNVAENNGGVHVGSYHVKLTLADPANYKWADGDAAELVLTFTITKATYDMSGVTFEDVTVDYDGQAHSIGIKGALPNGVTVTYEGNGKKAVGEYTVTAYFTGDARNYNPIPSMTALLKIRTVSHDLGGISFEDVTVKYDGNTHSIFIEGTLPANVTVSYEGNGQTAPNIYTVTAVFSDPDGEFDRKTATLIILRTHAQTELDDGSGVEVALDSEEGFDPTLELVVEKTENLARTYWVWEKDKVSEMYDVKMCKDGVEVPFDGTVTVRLFIPEEFRDRDFELRTVAGSENVAFTRDGDYVVFEADGLSEYVFASDYTPYFPIVIIMVVVLCVDVLGMIALVIVIKKRRTAKEEQEYVS